MNSDASFCLWNSSCHEALADAQNTGANVHLECCLIWCGETACISVEGLVREVNGREAQLVVRSMTMQAQNPKTVVNQGKFYFSVKRHIAQDMAARLGVYGSAQILETAVGPNGEMLYLSLRFSRHVTVRQLRSSKRIPWRAEYSRMSSVLLAPERPDTTNDLRIMLGEYSRVPPPATRIMDVSEGGACVCMPEELAIPSFTSDATYLFFLQPSVVPVTAPPYVFLAKRAGFGKAPDAQGIPVRLRFQEELDWSARRARLRWLNVKGGSPRLRQCLTKYADASKDQQESA
ncbi:MAG TPA: hypothetical protein VEZ52_14265 [Desulfovibrio sp.]|uniref:hypothetical protein n=1 Tax=Desulfovibrio sp. TaxID=885 RepID=UPI002D4A2255|nr:hypothetical protein [Desulfovibrio sp.]HZF62768.1 hypothetical protein [Desulfovibrio sp.]